MSLLPGRIQSGRARRSSRTAASLSEHTYRVHSDVCSLHLEVLFDDEEDAWRRARREASTVPTTPKAWPATATRTIEPSLVDGVRRCRVLDRAHERRCLLAGRPRRRCGCGVYGASLTGALAWVAHTGAGTVPGRETRSTSSAPTTLSGATSASSKASGDGRLRYLLFQVG